MSPFVLQVSVKRSEPSPTQTPLTHAWPAPHARPQTPQLAVSLARLRQVPEQLVCPAGHTQSPDPLHDPPAGEVHVPDVRGVALHTVEVPEHTMEPDDWHPPLPDDVHAAPVGRHTPPQFDCPAGQLCTQVLDVQLTVPPVGAVHTRPQAPQLLVSLARLRQVPPQLVSPEAHAQSPEALHTPPVGEVHAPVVRGVALHTVEVPEHTTVPGSWHPPLPGDVHVAPVGRHTPPQFDCPAGQLCTQTLATHAAEPPAGAAHVLPQRPQWAVVVRVSTSQPLPAMPSQSAKPGLHAPTAHALAAQAAVPFETEQRLPQRPQLPVSARRSTSQPLAGLPSQSAKPVSQRPTPHTPPVQSTVACGRAAQGRLHAPQFITSVAVRVSQPLLTSPSQSSVPEAHTPMPQAPARHTAVPLGGVGHALPQRPQFDTSVVVTVSQPFVGLMSQSAKPALHEATVHAPAAHPGAPLLTEHALPQRPQWPVAVRRSVSQPFDGSPSQSPKFSSQRATAQRPAVQAGVPCSTRQAVPHAPQCVTLVPVSVSQPLPAIMSQSASGAAQAPTAQAPMTHAAVPPITMHALPQRPQWPVLVRRSVSHPFSGFMSQSAKPSSQRPTAQRPPAQSGVPWSTRQAAPQVPQFITSVRVSTSQPFIAARSQSAKPSSQVPTPQVPIAQAAVPWAGAGQAVPQVPQCAVLVRTSVSQPVPDIMSQSPKPDSQAATAQAPITHDGVPCEAEHATSHMPQWSALVRRSTSQPFSGLMSQSAKPSSQVKPHTPAPQVARAWAGVGHARPHAPQFERSVRVSASQPLAAIVSQSRKAPVHVPTAHMPMSQRGSPLATVQAVPHAPQLAALACVSTQPPMQQVCPVGQRLESTQPIAQVLPMQRWPAGQCSSVTQSTQVCVVGLHRPPVTTEASPTPASSPAVARHASSEAQPRTQEFDAGSQYWPAWQVSPPGTHATQRPVARSHAGVAGVERHASSEVQPPASTSSAGTSSESVGAFASAAPPTTGCPEQPSALASSAHAASSAAARGTGRFMKTPKW